jgi:Tfp pilus assembly protein PilF
MTDENASVPEAPARRLTFLDRAAPFVVWILVAALLVVGGLFGYQVYSNYNAERNSSPSMRALRGLEQLAQKNPNSAAVRVRLAEAYATAGLDDKAVENLQAAVKLDKKHSGAYLDLGLLAMRANQPQVAEAHFTKVLELTQGGQFAKIDPRQEQALFYLGQIRIGQKRWDEAVTYLKGALRIRKDSSDSYYFLARAYEGLGDNDNARKNLNIALTFDPNYAAAHHELGLVYVSQSNVPSAAVEFRRALEINAQGTQSADQLAKFGTAASWADRATKSLAAGKTRDADKQGLTAISIDPTYVAAQLLYGRILEKEGDKSTALDRYKHVQELDPKNVEAAAAIKRLSTK